MTRKKWLVSMAMVFLVGALYLSACKGKAPSEQGAAGPGTPAETVVQFSQAVPDSVKGANFVESKCNVDRVNGQDTSTLTAVDVDRQQQLVLDGWAADVTKGVVSPSVIIELSPSGGSNYYASASRGRIRKDVAKAFGKPALEGSGFELKADIGSLPVGTYSLQVIQPEKGQVLACKYGKNIVIK
jgi:hypothetical protein